MNEFPYRITHPSVYIHTEPDITSDVCDELLYGTSLRTVSAPTPAIKGKGSYYRIETQYGYCGYINEKYLLPPDKLPEQVYSYITTSPASDLLPESAFRKRPLATIPGGSIVLSTRSSLQTGEKFFPVLYRGKKCYIRSEVLREHRMVSECPKEKTAKLRKSICDDALSYLGTAYRWGGKSTFGIDCSGLCFMSYFLNGIPLFRDSFADKRYVHETDFSHLEPGDLLYFKGHMALHIGDGEYVHSSATDGCVTVASLKKSSLLYREDLAKSLVCCAKSNLL